MKTILSVLVVILFMGTSTAYAEPSSSIKYLMNEPVTMFDWGLYKIKKNLEGYRYPDIDFAREHLVYVEYDWDLNRIKLELVVFPKYNVLTKIGPEEICRYVLMKTKEHFGYTEETDQDKKKMFVALFGMQKYFEHNCFTNKKGPESLKNDLQNLTRITVSVHTSRTNQPPFAERMSCTSILSKDNINYLMDSENEE